MIKHKKVKSLANSEQPLKKRPWYLIHVLKLITCYTRKTLEKSLRLVKSY